MPDQAAEPLRRALRTIRLLTDDQAVLNVVSEALAHTPEPERCPRCGQEGRPRACTEMERCPMLFPTPEPEGREAPGYVEGPAEVLPPKYAPTEPEAEHRYPQAMVEARKRTDDFLADTPEPDGQAISYAVWALRREIQRTHDPALRASLEAAAVRLTPEPGGREGWALREIANPDGKVTQRSLALWALGELDRPDLQATLDAMFASATPEPEGPTAADNGLQPYMATYEEDRAEPGEGPSDG